jgi:transcriptional regulator with XRE-family HTH domain
MKRLLELRKEKKLSQEGLSKILNVGQTTISSWERGEKEPDNATLIRLAEYFGVTTDYLLGLENEPPGDAFALSSDVDYDDLPPEALEEIKQFKEFVKSKYKKKDK